MLVAATVSEVSAKATQGATGNSRGTLQGIRGWGVLRQSLIVSHPDLAGLELTI